MTGLLTTVLALLCAAASLPVLVLLAQVLLARGARPAAGAIPARDAAAQLAVLVPAHNEAAGIEATLRGLQAQLRGGDRLLVIADNCSDDTATVARRAGAEVVERHHATQRGKGYALDFGVRHLAATRAPSIVLIVDADCQLDPHAVDILVHQCVASGRPVQALYEMNAPSGAGLRARVSAFAWRVRNRVRPLGWWRVGAPCQLMGTGMAFAWTQLRDAPLASGNIVEDVQLGVDLALHGTPPLFVPQARVFSEFPAADDAAAAQRRRWEHGNLSVMLRHGPRLLGAALARADLRLAAMAADLMVPPLALLVQLQLALALIGAAALLVGAGVLPLALCMAALALLLLAIVAAWRLAGRDVVGWSELVLTAPAYALRKLPMYLAFLWKRESTWVRAKREGE
jgi:cellulose synthase/poly-beta-1,6-N-acetylglucosamine synthase-like glycosyltransferase